MSILSPLVPGLALAGLVALAAALAEPALAALSGGRLALPALVIALIIGVALNGLASRASFQPGLTFCVKKLLRWAIGLLGLRIALGDIAGLGLGVALLVVLSMATTIVLAMTLARLLGREAGFGALAGAANAVCGASATLATATVVPNSPSKGADVAFAVVMANVLSTVVMLAYPPLCAALGFDARTTGIMLGATIHDMAQVVGAGYAVSEATGDTAVIVKLFRVFLLLPVVVGIGWWFTRQGEGTGGAKVPAPVFAFVFIALCGLNTLMSAEPALAASLAYAPIRTALIQASGVGLLVAIAALGLGTSFAALRAIGWRHGAVFVGATLWILLVVVTGLKLLG